MTRDPGKYSASRSTAQEALSGPFVNPLYCTASIIRNDISTQTFKGVLESLPERSKVLKVICDGIQ